MIRPRDIVQLENGRWAVLLSCGRQVGQFESFLAAAEAAGITPPQRERIFCQNLNQEIEL